ncbi:xanthine dehydrogenase family protein subunit M [Kutzneria buriramensis]|uniref:Xanthine dehydrogenase YagS FAD-binding subunit n=1 Tax=Kutzneria buriramensis TaxID=1045776 RepID=A0A3E0I6T4_9PSEU|nr:xanthine dehydrogenase family protein subunit M [Kutzneria buriramensis]REH54458.1 xanthine dehydrogenase YagS FAD-binding subunit [Kutzneria buriramensis]
MRGFGYGAAASVRQALTQGGDGTSYLAGGTTLVDLMKLEVMTPAHVVDINSLPLRGIQCTPAGLRIGALERMADVAVHHEVASRWSMVATALRLSASPQLRNMASIGGNLLQRTRCDYFRDVRMPCNKRKPGSGCPAVNGANRTHAVLGTSASCVATHASDLAVALVALDASIRLQDRHGQRVVRLADFYRLPGDTPAVENQLRPGELITEVIVPACDWPQAYVKVRDRTSYEFALASAAVAVDVHRGVVRDARIAVGGVGTRPWRLPATEEALRGKPATEESYLEAAKLAVVGAKPLGDNAFKLPLVQRTIARALAGAR